MGKSIEWKMDSCGKAAIIYREGEQYALSQVVNGYFEQKQRIEKLEGAIREHRQGQARHGDNHIDRTLWKILEDG